jgi:hypothetical protein
MAGEFLFFVTILQKLPARIIDAIKNAWLPNFFSDASVGFMRYCAFATC